MAFLKKQAARLMREADWTATELAEEIHSIFNSEEPFQVDGPVIINNTTGADALTINNYNSQNNPVVINNYPDVPVDFPGFPPNPPYTPGNTTIIIVNNDGLDRETDDPTTPAPPTPDPFPTPDTGGGGGFPGRVISGSASTYQVAVYEDGLSLAPTTQTVTQLQIASDAVIPAGTWALVGKINDEYFMQVPVWLQDLT